jgi:hypothetical protein
MTSESECRRRVAALLALGLAAAPIIAACGSGPVHRAASSSGVSAACTKVGAVLSDGPDPVADPVGYAEAQIRPLRGIKIQDPGLRAAVSDLASGYAAVFDSNGKNAAAAKSVKAAIKKVNAICKGAVA